MIYWQHHYHPYQLEFEFGMPNDMDTSKPGPEARSPRQKAVHISLQRRKIKLYMTDAATQADDSITITAKTMIPTTTRRETGGYGFAPPKQTSSGRPIKPAVQY